MKILFYGEYFVDILEWKDWSQEILNPFIHTFIYTFIQTFVEIL